jgi:predicted transcriptional regulator
MSIAVSPEKQAKLDAIAREAQRSRNWIVNEAIDQYLDLHEWQTRRIQERLARAESGTATFYTSDDVDNVVRSFAP